MGTTQWLALGSQDYIDLGLWKPVSATNHSAGHNITGSDAMALGGIVVRNDVRSAVESYLQNTTVSGGSVSVTAVEDAVLRATADSSAKASGGSAYGSGTMSR